MNNKNIFNNRKLKYGIAFYSVIAIVVAIVVLLNVIASTLSNKIDMSLDLTSNKVFKLTNDSKDFISKLNEEVEIVVLNDENRFESYNKYMTQANRVIKQYSQVSDKIKVNYVDTVSNPSYLSQYSSEQITANNIIVKSGNKHRILSVNDLFNISQYERGSKITASKAENTVTSAIMYVTSSIQEKVAVVKGYSEQEITGLISLLSNNNFEVVEVPILVEDIPKDASSVVLVGAQRDYDQKGIEKLESFMENDGNRSKGMVVMSDVMIEDQPVLNGFLEKYGIKIESQMVFETDARRVLGSNPFHYICSYSEDDEYSSSLKDPSIPVFSPYSKSIKILDEENVKSLLTTSSQSGTVKGEMNENWRITKDQIDGPHNCGVVSTKNDSKVFVFGSSLIADEQALNQTSTNNASYLLNIFKSLRSEQNSLNDINIEPVSLETAELGANVVQANILRIVFVFVIPLFTLFIGVVLVLRRKNKAIMSGRGEKRNEKTN